MYNISPSSRNRTGKPETIDFWMEGNIERLSTHQRKGVCSWKGYFLSKAIFPVLLMKVLFVNWTIWIIKVLKHQLDWQYVLSLHMWCIPFCPNEDFFSVEHKVNRDLLQVMEAFEGRVENLLKAGAELQLGVLPFVEWQTRKPLLLQLFLLLLNSYITLHNTTEAHVGQPPGVLINTVDTNL